MKLKVGYLVAFKKYEDMTDEEHSGISKDSFPEFGKVSNVNNEVKRFFVEGEPYAFNQGSIDYIIGKGVTGKINVGDEVLVKATVSSTNGKLLWLEPIIFKEEIVKVLKHKEEHFIVQEDHYGMYVNGSEVLVVNKDDAKIYDSRNEANEVAADMHLNAWEVIPYDD
jgi:hypothetical protein|nr:MAG TPA: protein of unknown function (DUF4839) [Caudoviricetes sp.]